MKHRPSPHWSAGEKLKAGMKRSSTGAASCIPSRHSSMFGLFFAPQPPDNYRAWKKSGFYDKLARHMQDNNII
jgi:glutamate-1-semialdehyde 2,1-aminomutase